MTIPININDGEIMSMTRMPNIGQIIDKAFKKQRSDLIRMVAYERRLMLATNEWFNSMTDEDREIVMKNLRSSIDLEEIIDKDIRDRDLVLEAAQRYRTACKQDLC